MSGKQPTEITFSSVLAPYIEAHIKEKRCLGFDYTGNEKVLFRFDKFCTEKGLDTVNVPKSFLDEWCNIKETEGLWNQLHRIKIVRQLMLYMASTGIEVYVPKFKGRIERSLPHIFTDEELQAFFNEVDSYMPSNDTLIRLGYEYRVLFRLMFCCGLRISEACGLATEHVNLKDGFLDIIDAKGHKDRRVYMADDLTELCREYHEYLCNTLHIYPEWYFPAKDSQRPLKIFSVEQCFNRYWSRTPYAGTCNNKPTSHDLRYTFITYRINDWSANGVDVDVLMPYLQKYVGHKNVQNTYYYYHNTEELYKSIREKDKTSESLIPEVKNHE